MSVPKSSGVIADLMKLNNGQMVSFKGRGGKAFKYLQLQVSLWWFWLCSHRRKDGKKGPSIKDRRGRRSTKSNEENEKGQDGHDKSEVGEAEATQWRKMDFKTASWTASHRGRELNCLCACWRPSWSSCSSFWTCVSTVTERRPLGISVPLLTCWSHSHRHSMVKQQKQAQTQMQMQQLSYSDVNIRKLAHT